MMPLLGLACVVLAVGVYLLQRRVRKLGDDVAYDSGGHQQALQGLEEFAQSQGRMIRALEARVSALEGQEGQEPEL
jgi:hypothetical protein